MCKPTLLIVLLSLGVLQAQGSVINAPAPFPANVLATPAMAAPVNDLCSAVTVMPLPIGGALTFTGDNTEATFTGDAVAGSLLDEYPFPNTWHAFTTTDCANVTVSYCATDSGWSNVWRLLTTQCPADSVIQASISDQTTCGNGNWTFRFNQLAPGTYYLPVPNVGFGQGGGPYSIIVSAADCSDLPTNDLCTEITPVPLTVGSTISFTGDNTNATFPGDAVPGSLLDQFPFADTWHAFTTTQCANVTVSYCATDSGWSNVWRLLTTQCPADEVIQSSTSEQTTCANGNWTFRFNQLAPGTYYLPVPNVGFGQGGGAYSIDVSAMTCGNDLCGDINPVALPIGSTLTFIGDNTNATFPGDAVPRSLLDQFPFADSWHAFTTTQCANITVSYCATDSGWSNVWKLLTEVCPADAVINATTSEQTTCANGNWTFSFAELPAGTYYLPVPNVGFGQGGGAYSIDVSAVSCGIDHCADISPQTLTLGGMLTFTGDNTNATFPGDAVPGSLLDQFPFPDTWHAFTTTQCANITVSYCATDSGWSNVWKLLTEVCPADAVINATTSGQTTCANGNWTFSFAELPAGTYYLPVPNVGFGQGGGPYSITVNATACSNDLCGNVTPEALTVGGSLTFTGDNTNATFPGDAVPGSFLDQFPFPDTWHAFTTSECSDVTVSYCATDSGWSNVWRLLTMDCPADATINAYTTDTTSCGNGNWTFSFHQLQPGTYYLPVPNVGFGQGGGPYSIDVNSSACIPDHVNVVNGNRDWTVYPNPTNGEVTIIAPRELGTATLELIDMTGRTMYSTELVITANGTHQLSLGGFAPGTYALRMTTASERSTQLLILK